jgi:hypothetical protein
MYLATFYNVGSDAYNTLNGNFYYEVKTLFEAIVLVRIKASEFFRELESGDAVYIREMPEELAKVNKLDTDNAFAVVVGTNDDWDPMGCVTIIEVKSNEERLHDALNSVLCDLNVGNTDAAITTVVSLIEDL